MSTIIRFRKRYVHCIRYVLDVIGENSTAIMRTFYNVYRRTRIKFVSRHFTAGHLTSFHCVDAHCKGLMYLASSRRNCTSNCDGLVYLFCAYLKLKYYNTRKNGKKKWLLLKITLRSKDQYVGHKVLQSSYAKKPVIR